jgi:outer membrane protein TolC
VIAAVWLAGALAPASAQPPVFAPRPPEQAPVGPELFPHRPEPVAFRAGEAPPVADVIAPSDAPPAPPIETSAVVALPATVASPGSAGPAGLQGPPGDLLGPSGPTPLAAEVAPGTAGLIRPESELKTWWHDQLVAPMGPPERSLPMQIERAVVQALSTSAQVSVLRETAAISETLIPQAEATFDPVAFLDTRFTDTSDPVGNTLTTGGSPRFIDHNWYSNGGLKKQTLSGAKVELGQRFGFQNTNSTFFVPKDQATAKLMLNITQPILRGAGRAYNNGVVVLANVDVQVARTQYLGDLQNYLVDFHSSYWDIYLQRAVLLQRRRLLHEARDILSELEARRDVDVQVSQLARARAAVGNREAGQLRYEAAVKDAVSRFKALVNDPYLDNPAHAELIPLDSTDAGYGDADLDSSLTTALEHRPEIDGAMQEIRGATQRLDLAKNEVLPMLDLVIGSYVYGLRGQTDFSEAFANQFDTGRPTYWAGLLFERPLGNRAPRAVRQQRVLELQRAVSKLRVVTANVRAEVEIAVREISTTRGEMVSRHQAMLAEQEQVNYLLQRWRILAGDQQVAGVVFNDLLDAQDRRAAAEYEFVTSQVAHRVAWVKLRRAMGTLCDCSAMTPADLAAPQAEPVPTPPPAPASVPFHASTPALPDSGTSASSASGASTTADSVTDMAVAIPTPVPLVAPALAPRLAPAVAPAVPPAPAPPVAPMLAPTPDRPVESAATRPFHFAPSPPQPEPSADRPAIAEPREAVPFELLPRDESRNAPPPLVPLPPVN